MNKEIDIKQIRELMEGFLKEAKQAGFHSWVARINKILALLPCPTCKGSKIKPCKYDMSDPDDEPCPTCQTEPKVCTKKPKDRDRANPCKRYMDGNCGDCPDYKPAYQAEPAGEWEGGYKQQPPDCMDKPAEKPESSTRAGNGCPARFFPEGEFAKWFEKEYPLPATLERGPVGRDLKRGCEKAYKAALDTANARLKEQEQCNLIGDKLLRKATARADAAEAENKNKSKQYLEEKTARWTIEEIAEKQSAVIKQLKGKLKAKEGEIAKSRMVILRFDHYCRTNGIDMEQFLKATNA